MLFCTTGTTGYVDVNDVVKSMIALMRSNISGERFILNADNPTYEQFFTIVAGSINARKPLIRVPGFFSYLVMPAVQLLEIVTRGKSVLTKEMIRVAWSRITYDNSKIIKYTGITFKPIERSVKEIGKIYLEEKPRVPR